MSLRQQENVIVKAVPTGVRVNGKLYKSIKSLKELFGESPKGVNRQVRKALYNQGLRGLASVRSE